MGTNYYGIKIPTKKDKDKIKDAENIVRLLTK